MNRKLISISHSKCILLKPHGDAGAHYLITVPFLLRIFHLLQGQIIVDARLEDDLYEIFDLIDKLKFPIGKVIPIVAYRWEDGDSMAGNNSSGFNFRVIAGTNKISLHSFGRAIDINPVQNPVIYPTGIIAPAGATYRPQNKGTFTVNHPIVQEFTKRGWHWGGNFEQPKDYHHFEKT